MKIKSTLVVLSAVLGIQYSNAQTEYPIKQADQEVNGSPWYGLGQTSEILPGSSYQSMQLAGYYGLILKTGSGEINMQLDGKVGIGLKNPLETLHINGNGMIQSYSPVLKLRRSTNNGGYIQGILTETSDGNPNFWFGNLHDDEWLISKGDYEGTRLFTVKASGKVGIGTKTPDSKLSVKGDIHAQEVRVDLNGWSDFVFENNYDLPSLEAVEKHINTEGHLLDIPSEKEVLEHGILLGEMDSKLLQKIEELTLYTIEQEKKIKKLEASLKAINEANKNTVALASLLEEMKSMQAEIEALKN